MWNLLLELVRGSLDTGSLVVLTLCIAFLLLVWRVPLILAHQWTSHAEARWQYELNMRLLDIIEAASRAKPAAAPSNPNVAPPLSFDLEAKGLTPTSIDCDRSSIDCDSDN